MTDDKPITPNIETPSPIGKRWYQSKGFVACILLTLAWLAPYCQAIYASHESASILAGHFPYVAGAWSAYLVGQKYVDGEQIKRS